MQEWSLVNIPKVVRLVPAVLKYPKGAFFFGMGGGGAGTVDMVTTVDQHGSCVKKRIIHQAAE